MSPLASHLSAYKDRYLRDISGGKGKAKEWTVVMGNEAGDLDSIACSIGYAWLNTCINNTPTIPLIQTKRRDLPLRPENIYALTLTGLSEGLPELLCVNDLPKNYALGDKFVLVDHNRLVAPFSSSPTAQVTAIIDHHADENQHLTANPRIVIPGIGSCASILTARLFLGVKMKTQFPRELATLLLCAILIDTGGLKEGGKATKVDWEAVGWLLPRSSVAQHLPAGIFAGLLARMAEFDNEPHTNQNAKEGEHPVDLLTVPAIRDLTTTLTTKKVDVSSFSTLSLLRRDYKEYTLSPVPITLGLSSVPRRLEGCEGLEKWARVWMERRGLSVLGVLTSWKDEEVKNKEGKAKHRREQAWFVRAAGDNSNDEAQDPEMDDVDEPPSSAHVLTAAEADALADALWIGLQASDDLRLKAHPQEASLVGEQRTRRRAYMQKNTDATRKVTAPVVKGILEEALRKDV